MTFAKREGAGGIVVVNLFGLRATDPKAIDEAWELEFGPFGEGNHDALGAALLDNRRATVCAWGAHAEATYAARAFINRARSAGKRLVCLGKTRNGSPRHPLYVRADQPFEEFP